MNVQCINGYLHVSDAMCPPAHRPEKPPIPALEVPTRSSPFAPAGGTITHTSSSRTKGVSEYLEWNHQLKGITIIPLLQGSKESPGASPVSPNQEQLPCLAGPGGGSGRCRLWATTSCTSSAACSLLPRCLLPSKDTSRFQIYRTAQTTSVLLAEWQALQARE